MMMKYDQPMARPARGGRLWQRMLARAWELDFFQAVWLLERHLPDGVAVGERGPAGDERLRFRPDVSMGFPSTDVRRIRVCRDLQSDRPFFRLDVTFMGLYGVSTPLPLHYATRVVRSVNPEPEDMPEGAETPVSPEDIRIIDGRGDATPIRDFLDLLHHRLISLFYRAWTKYRYDVAFVIPARDHITGYLLHLIGLNPETDRSDMGVDPLRLIRYAGALTQHPKSAVALEGVLFDYWNGRIPTKVEQFRGRWVPIAPEDENRLGAANSRLGVDLTVGSQIYDLSGMFNIQLGPVDWQAYLALLPDSEAHQQTRDLARLYCTDPFSFTLEIRLKASQAPASALSSGGGAARLGYTGWVRTADVPETSITFDESSVPPRNRRRSPDTSRPDVTLPAAFEAPDDESFSDQIYVERVETANVG